MERFSNHFTKDDNFVKLNASVIIYLIWRITDSPNDAFFTSYKWWSEMLEIPRIIDVCFWRNYCKWDFIVSSYLLGPHLTQLTPSDLASCKILSERIFGANWRTVVILYSEGLAYFNFLLTTFLSIPFKYLLSVAKWL